MLLVGASPRVWLLVCSDPSGVTAVALVNGEHMHSSQRDSNRLPRRNGHDICIPAWCDVFTKPLLAAAQRLVQYHLALRKY